jgi:hypothetical protein
MELILRDSFHANLKRWVVFFTILWIMLAPFLCVSDQIGNVVALVVPLLHGFLLIGFIMHMYVFSFFFGESFKKLRFTHPDVWEGIHPFRGSYMRNLAKLLAFSRGESDDGSDATINRIRSFQRTYLLVGSYSLLLVVLNMGIVRVTHFYVLGSSSLAVY